MSKRQQFTIISAPKMGSSNPEGIIARDVLNYWGGVNTSVIVELDDWGLPRANGFSRKAKFENKPDILVREKPFCIVFFEEKSEGWSPIVIGNQNGEIKNFENFEREIEVLAEDLSGGELKKLHERLTTLSMTGFEYVIEGTRCLAQGVPNSKKPQIEEVNNLFNLGTPYWIDSTVYQYTEYLLAKAGIDQFFKEENWRDGYGKSLVPFRDAIFFGSFVLPDYLGSENINAEDAAQSLGFTKNGEWNVTSTQFTTKKTQSGWILNRKLGKQYLLRVDGSWFICEPRRCLIKTISDTEKDNFISLINEGIKKNWNGESLPPDSVF